MSSANSRYLAPKIPGGLLMSFGSEFTPGEQLVVQWIGDLTYSKGDILYFNGTQLTNLPIGSTGNVLTVAAGLPSWAAGGSSGGFQIPTGSVNGANKVFVFITAPNAICVDGVVFQKTSQDTTVNWTGATTVTLSVAPSSSVFGVC